MKKVVTNSLLLFIILLFGECNYKQTNKEIDTYYYKDFDIFQLNGINEISDTNGTPFVKVKKSNDNYASKLIVTFKYNDSLIESQTFFKGDSLWYRQEIIPYKNYSNDLTLSETIVNQFIKNDSIITYTHLFSLTTTPYSLRLSSISIKTRKGEVVYNNFQNKGEDVFFIRDDINYINSIIKFSQDFHNVKFTLKGDTLNEFLINKFKPYNNTTTCWKLNKGLNWWIINKKFAKLIECTIN